MEVSSLRFLFSPTGMINTSLSRRILGALTLIQHFAFTPLAIAVICALPSPFAFTTPLVVTSATFSLLLSHLTCLLGPSTAALNEIELPFPSVYNVYSARLSVTVGVKSCTVTCTRSSTPFAFNVTVADPVPFAVSFPLLTVTTFELEVVQAEDLLRPVT